MLRIMKYSFFDLIRSRWSFVYFGFYFVLGMALLFLNNDVSKAIITMMNIIVVLTPLIGTIFGVMYYYNSKEFNELLMAQPLKRSTIFLGQYFGLALSLAGSLALGLGIPFAIYGVVGSAALLSFVLLLAVGALLTFIFVALAYNIGLANDNKIKGFGLAILIWLFLAVVYDGVFLISLFIFDDYPIDKFSLIASTLNPIDLSRILIILELDISVLLGYTGAVFQKFFGTSAGMITSFGLLFAWAAAPIGLIVRQAKKKDF